MAKNKGTPDRGQLNRFAVKRLISCAEQLHQTGVIDDASIKAILDRIDMRRMAGAGTGSDEIENANANLDAGAQSA